MDFRWTKYSEVSIIMLDSKPETTNLWIKQEIYAKCQLLLFLVGTHPTPTVKPQRIACTLASWWTSRREVIHTASPHKACSAACFPNPSRLACLPESPTPLLFTLSISIKNWTITGYRSVFSPFARTRGLSRTMVTNKHTGH